jgi:protein-tyrosine phosphatase
LFGLFKSNNNAVNVLDWDMHSHVLSAIDDGAQTIEDSLDMLDLFVKLKYKKIIVTPHIMQEYYQNTREIIEDKCNELRKIISEKQLPIDIDFAAEYMMDLGLMNKIANNEDLLVFNGKHVLIETPFLNKPVFFEKVIFDLLSKNYQPVLAHPERYVYLHQNPEIAESMINSGLKFQLNLLSLVGYYSPDVKKFASWLINKGYYSLLGSDAHKVSHIDKLDEVFKSKIFNKIDFTKVENAKGYE